MSPGRPDLTRAFLARRGGPIGTGGLGAVALRWDHWTDHAAPLVEIHRELGLPWSWAHYSHQRDVEGHSLPWEDIQQHALSDGGEPWAHSQTHTDATTTEGLTREIVTSCEELRDALPGCVIEGFAIPGVGGSKWNGFTDTLTIEHFTGTEAGQLVLGTYAVSTGHIRPLERHLDGTVRQGLLHQTIERRVAADVLPLIERARDTATGLSLMLHPRRVGQPGYLPLADYRQIAEFIAAERDAGRLLPLTLSGLTVADSAGSTRHDLLRNGDFGSGLDHWDTGGWTHQVGRVLGLPPRATTATTEDDGATLTQVVSAQDLAGLRGGTRELVVQAWARPETDVDASLRVQVNDDVIDRTHPVPGGRDPVTIRLPHVLDTRRDTHTITLTKLGSGRVSVRGLRLQSI